jgi:hypothetical protein
MTKFNLANVLKREIKDFERTNTSIKNLALVLSDDYDKIKDNWDNINKTFEKINDGNYIVELLKSEIEDRQFFIDDIKKLMEMYQKVIDGEEEEKEEEPFLNKKRKKKKKKEI